MKATVTQENLNKALSVVSRVASSRTSLPILSNILFKTEKNRLLLAATNLEIANTQVIGAKITNEGSLTVPARLITEFVANLPKGNIDLTITGTKLTITAGSYTSTINGMLADEFPALPKVESEQIITLSSALLKTAIAQTVITASHDDTRPVLTGVLCHTYEGSLYFAATDGYRLAERRLLESKDEIKALIPASTMNEVARVIPDDCDEVQVIFDGAQVLFRMDDIEVTSRLIEGNFPDYRQLIPKQTEIHAVVDKSDLLRITKIAGLFARESGGSITLHTSPQTKTISIHSVASQLGENTSEATAEVDSEGSVTLNSRYLTEALNCFSEQTVNFGFSGKLAPCVISSTDDKTSDYQHIVMPLRS